MWINFAKANAKFLKKRSDKSYSNPPREISDHFPEKKNKCENSEVVTLTTSISNFQLHNTSNKANEILRVFSDLQISISLPGAEMSQTLSQAGYSCCRHSVPNLHDEYSLIWVHTQLHHPEGVTPMEGISTSQRKFTDRS